MSEMQSDTPGDLAAVVDRILSPASGTAAADSIQAIRWADELGRISQSHLHASVVSARANAVSWQQIGDALGTSRQAAFKRFGTTHDNSTGESAMSQPMINLIERTESVFKSLSDGEYDSVKSLMTFTCSRALSKRKVMSVWEHVTASTGKFESCSDTVIQLMDGRGAAEQLANRYLTEGVVGQTQLNHEAGEWKGRVAFNGRGKITGILIVSPLAENLPF